MPRDIRRGLNSSFLYSGVSAPVTQLLRKQEILSPPLLRIQPLFSFRSTQGVLLRAERNVCSQVNFWFLCFSEKKIRKFDPSRDNLFAQSQYCIGSAALVYLSFQHLQESADTSTMVKTMLVCWQKRKLHQHGNPFRDAEQ